MKKLIIAVGIIAAILAVLISFKAKSQLKIIGGTFDVRTVAGPGICFDIKCQETTILHMLCFACLFPKRQHGKNGQGLSQTK